jgi:hypothetical protein
MFQHDSAIPIDFALSVHAVIHGDANEGHWFRIMLEENPIPWIKSIYISNKSEWNVQEEIWWNTQLER